MPNLPQAHKLKVNATHQGLLINPTHLLAVKVRGTVLTQARVELPDGVIQNGSLHDITVFREKLQAILKQIQFTSSTITLSLPEHQAFVKHLEVDPVPLEELNDAILYQLDSYLPFPVEKLQVDWCILDQPAEGKIHIQVVALPRVLIDDYIHILQAVSLKIVAIETPSQTLTRLIQSAPHPALIIDAEPTTHLVFSSIPGAVDFSAIIEGGGAEPTMSQINQYATDMINHYQKKYHQQVNKILVTGSRAQEYVQKLKVLVQPELVSIIEYPPEQQVAHTLSEKGINPPTDPTTINLLPVQLISGTESENPGNSMYTRIINISFIFLLIFNLIAGIFLARVWAAQLNLSTNSANQPAFSSITAAGQIKQVNAQIDTVLKVAPARDQMAKLTDQVLKVLPAGVQLTNINIDTNTHTLSLSGTGATHQDILNLKSSLEGQNNFTQIKIPLSIFEKQENIPFTMSLTWELLKQ